MLVPSRRRGDAFNVNDTIAWLLRSAIQNCPSDATLRGLNGSERRTSIDDASCRCQGARSARRPTLRRRLRGKTHRPRAHEGESGGIRATGAPKPLLDELATLTFVERAENVVLLGPSSGAFALRKQASADEIEGQLSRGALGGTRRGLPRFPQGQALGEGCADHGHAFRAEEDAEWRVFSVDYLQHGR